MHSVFGPASSRADAVATLGYWMLGGGAIVWVLVIGVMLWAIRTRRTADAARTHRVVLGAVYTTILILVGFLVYDFGVGRALAEHPPRALTIEVVGQQWWWQVTYLDPDPSKRVVTANEIHVPVGRAVQIKLRSADVIHSFWVPSLGGKRDLVPGYRSVVWFRADTAGVYRGQCAEFCGLQHAHMAMFVVAEPSDKFEAWLAASRAPATPPTDSATQYGQRVFMTRGCASCHAIAGTDAWATVGPDLTHLKARATIAAGSFENTPGNLAGWVVDPSALKPGTRMPSIPLSGPELQALLTYLETLK